MFLQFVTGLLSLWQFLLLVVLKHTLCDPQDPLKASDKPLTDCGPYILDEEDAMVYRRPYLTSGASGFALVALSRNLKNELKVSETPGETNPWLYCSSSNVY